MFRSKFIDSELSEMFNLKNIDTQLANVQSTTFKNLNKVVFDAMLSQIFLSFKFKIIKFKKMRKYKNQSKNEH